MNKRRCPLEREMAAVIRGHWEEKTDSELAGMMTRAWGVRVYKEAVRTLRVQLGFHRHTDSIHRGRGRPPGSRLKPEPIRGDFAPQDFPLQGAAEPPGVWGGAPPESPGTGEAKVTNAQTKI